MGSKLVLSLVNDVSEYQRLLKTDAVAAARRAGFDLEVLYGEDSNTTQVRQLRDCVRRPPGERPYAILIFPARDASVERVAQEAVQAGVGWVILNRRADYLAALRESSSQVPIGMVGPDQFEVGRLQARQVRALLPDGGYLLYVLGTTLASAAQDRVAGLREGLEGARINLGEVTGNWHTDDADQAVGAWLEMVLPSGLRLGVVACQNDAMAVGARSAVERIAAKMNRPELARVPVTGVDGLAHVGGALVDQGRLTATVVQPSSTGPAIELIARHEKGQPIPASTVLPLSSHPGLEQLGRGRTGR